MSQTSISDSINALATRSGIIDKKIIAGLNKLKNIPHARIDTPKIISPLNNSTVVNLNEVTVITNNFNIIDGTDRHIKSNWKLTSDSGGENILASSFNDKANLTSKTFTNLELTLGGKYYLHAQHVGKKYGGSNWSDPIMFVGSTSTTGRGFTLTRSISNISTIVTYKSPIDGTTDLRMEVVDAQYRGNKLKFGTFKKDSSLKNHNTIGAHGGWYFNDTVPTIDCQTELPPDFNATQLYTNWNNLKTDLTAKENCDVWMTYATVSDSTTAADGGPIVGVPAVQYTRELVVDGNGWNLPNIYQLMIIFILSEELDALDPTAFANPTKALGMYANPAGRWVFDGENGAWSSTEYNSERTRYVYYTSLCDHNRKYMARMVIPIRELTSNE